MADFLQPLLNNVTPSSATTLYSSSFDTKDFRDFAFKLRMPSTGNTGAGTVDFYIEASSESDFSNAYKTMVLTLTESDNSTTAIKFNQVTNNVTLPAATETTTVLRQMWNLKDSNIDRYIRVKYVVTGTVADFAGITLDLLANRKV